MDYFKGINNAERYNNELLNELRGINQRLEQIAQLLQPKGEDIHVIHPTEGVPVNSPGKRQPRQRNSNGNRAGGKRKPM